jgi:hypothetical protein
VTLPTGLETDDRAHDGPVKDVVLTVFVAIVLALLFMYLLLSLVASGWGDRSPQASISAMSGSSIQSGDTPARWV